MVFNIRTNDIGAIYPNLNDIRIDGSPPSDSNYIKHSSSNKNQNILPYNASDRSRTILYPFVFTNLNSTNWIHGASPIPLVRSMVLNYKDINSVNSATKYPFLDLLFTGNTMRHLVPLPGELLICISPS